MTNRHLAALVLSLATISHAACGDDDEDPVIKSGLPADQKLSTLDDEDAETACKNVSRGFESVVPDGELKRVTCTMFGITAGIPDAAGGDEDEAIAACEQTTSDCQADELEVGPGEDIDIGPPSDEQCEDAEVASWMADCDATVAEYERCVSGYVAELKIQLAGIQCDMLSDLDSLDFEIAIGIEMIEQCEPIRDKCPGVEPFGDDMAEGDQG